MWNSGFKIKARTSALYYGKEVKTCFAKTLPESACKQSSGENVPLN